LQQRCSKLLCWLSWSRYAFLVRV